MKYLDYNKKIHDIAQKIKELRQYLYMYDKKDAAKDYERKKEIKKKINMLENKIEFIKSMKKTIDEKEVK